MDFSNLSEELKEKARACTSTEELLALAKSEGIDLSDDELAAVSGGCHCVDCDDYTCKKVCASAAASFSKPLASVVDVDPKVYLM